MHPSPGIDIDDAIAGMRHLAQSAKKIERPPISTGVEGVRAKRDEYLAWVDEAEHQLVKVFGPEALLPLHTNSYRQIHSMDILGPRPLALINNEIARQGRRLDALAKELNRRREFYTTEETIFVLDTNVFLHFHTLNNATRWRDEALHPSSLVLVPLRVVQELDLKKQSTNNRLAKRARKTLRLMNDVLDGQLTGPVVNGVTLSVAVERDVHDHQADEEVLNVAALAQIYAKREVTVLTGDFSMQLRARAYGLRSAAMPESLRFPLDESEAETDP